MAGLRDADGIDWDAEVVDMEGDWEGIREAISENDEPVIVTIANPNPFAELVGDHAIVVFQIENFGEPNERIIYMDPESGTYESKKAEEFLLWWDTPGQRGFVLRG